MPNGTRKLKPGAATMKAVLNASRPTGPGDPVYSYIKYYRGSKQERNLTVYTRREKPWFLLKMKKAK